MNSERTFNYLNELRVFMIRVESFGDFMHHCTSELIYYAYALSVVT